MYGLPQSTEVKKQLPKRAIYAKFDMSASQRESFDADVSTLYIIGIVSPRTVPAIAEGMDVKEIYVLALQMKRKEYDAKNITLLTRLIPQRMVFALQYEEEVQFAIYHTKLICSEWMSRDADSFPIGEVGRGLLNLDTVWENLVRGIGGILPEENFSLTEQIFFSDLREKTLKQIATLERKMASEKQPRRKRELFEQIKELKKQL
ncbi:MAG: DUF4391 domain-containing protein [Bacteroidaceae bacterium]|nr:DUF4391 domain-containing protein [Bacteroidaceae bacterium]